MIYFWLIKEAFISLFRHKVRAFLAVIGVAVGITAVVVLISVGNGVKKDISQSIEGIGSNMVVVLSGKIDTQSSGMNQGSVGNPANFISGDILSQDDVAAIKKIDGVKAVSPLALVSGTLKNGDKLSTATTAGSLPDLANIMTGYKVKYGRFISDADYEKNVLVVGDMVKSQLFSDQENVVGEKVQFKNDEFEIIGQLEKPSGSGQLLSNDMDSIAIMPFSTARKLNGNKDKILRIAATTDSTNQVKPAIEAIKKDMLTRHKEDEFSVLSQEDLLGFFSKAIDMLTTLITAIAAISLLVGGIGISSVMFMSVADRTREIGIRKAIGATSGLIMFQFIIESVVLAVLGGVVGLIASFGINHLLVVKTVLRPDVTSTAIILALGFCMGVGVLFGLIPAARAAAKDPVEALREG